MSRSARRSRPRSTPRSSQMTTSDANTSTDESRPKATSETEPARRPATIDATPSSVFQRTVTYSSLNARRRRCDCPGLVIGSDCHERVPGRDESKRPPALPGAVAFVAVRRTRSPLITDHSPIHTSANSRQAQGPCHAASMPIRPGRWPQIDRAQLPLDERVGQYVLNQSIVRSARRIPISPGRGSFSASPLRSRV